MIRKSPNCFVVVIDRVLYAVGCKQLRQIVIVQVEYFSNKILIERVYNDSTNVDTRDDEEGQETWHQTHQSFIYFFEVLEELR